MCTAGFYVTPIIPFFMLGLLCSHIPKGNLLGRLCKSYVRKFRITNVLLKVTPTTKPFRIIFLIIINS